MDKLVWQPTSTQARHTHTDSGEEGDRTSNFGFKPHSFLHLSRYKHFPLSPSQRRSFRRPQGTTHHVTRTAVTVCHRSSLETRSLLLACCLCPRQPRRWPEAASRLPHRCISRSKDWVDEFKLSAKRS